MADAFADTGTELWAWGSLLDRSTIATGIGTGFRLQRVNDALCELVGLASGEVVGRDLRSFVDPEHGAELAAIERALHAGGSSASIQVSLTRPDGADRHASMEIVVLEPATADRPPRLLFQAVDLNDLHRARLDVAASGRRFSKLLTNARDIISLLDADGVMLYSTATNVGALGFPEDHWTGWRPLEVVHPDDTVRARAAWDDVLAQPGVAVDVEVRMPHGDGGWVDLVLTGVNLLDDPDVAGVVMTARNVTQLRHAERIASRQAAVLELIARSAPIEAILDRCVDLLQIAGSGGRSAIWLVDEGHLHLRTGRPDLESAPPEALGRSVLAATCPLAVPDLDDLVGGPDAEIDHEVRSALAAEGIRAYCARPILAHGSNRAIGACGTVFDHAHEATPEELRAAELASSLVAVALDRIDTEDRLAHQALHDALTGLPNRTLLLDRLDHALARRERTGTKVAVLFCDLDRFKVVNDSLGHGVGDQLLKAAAERLEATISHGDTVARFGGDEFVLLLEDVDAEDDAIAVATRISKALARPFQLPGGQDVYLTTSIGIAFASDHASGDGWLRDADAAMYRAKEQGRDQLVVFDTEMRDAAVLRLQIEHDLHRAVERGELVLHYLPTIDLFSGRIVGSEALVRWHHPVRGLLWPGEFVPVAEETGVIDEVGRHVLDVATRDMAQLLDGRPIGDFQLGVNISARQIARGDVVSWVSELCVANGWPLENLLLEVTETALSHELGEPSRELALITERGVKFAIDDFGTGHSSLTRLGLLPVRQVKVDRSFVEVIDSTDAASGAGRARIVDAVIAIARALDLRTCAEGVESDAQLDYLRQIGCDYAQGYLFSEPLPIEQFAALYGADPRW